MHRLQTILISLALASCAGGDPTAPRDPDAPAAPAALLSAVSGADQQGVTGEVLTWPLKVRVLDEAQRPLPGVGVIWTVVSGDAELNPNPPRFRSPNAVASLSDQDGFATVWLRPMAPGQHTVVADLLNRRSSPVTFTATSMGLAVIQITVAPIFDCTPSGDPAWFTGTLSPIVVGQLVELTYDPHLNYQCAARIATTNVPTGGTSFDSGLIYAGTRVTFRPNVAGEWILEESLSGGRGTLSVFRLD